MLLIIIYDHVFSPAYHTLYNDKLSACRLTHSARTLSSARSEKSVTRTASMGEEIEEELDEEIEDIEEDISAADDFLKDSQSGVRAPALI